MALVMCEHPDHNVGHRTTGTLVRFRAVHHDESPECIWPHYVTPAGPQPQVGHPLLVTE